MYYIINIIYVIALQKRCSKVDVAYVPFTCFHHPFNFIICYCLHNNFPSGTVSPAIPYACLLGKDFLFLLYMDS